jgi:hypothetical protein
MPSRLRVHAGERAFPRSPEEVVRGGVEPPTFRFSGVAEAQIRGRCCSVDGCRRVPMVGAGCRRCRHRCRQLAGHPTASGEFRRVQPGSCSGSARRSHRPAAPSPAVPVAKLSCPPHCLERELPAARSMKVAGTGAGKQLDWADEEHSASRRLPGGPHRPGHCGY